MNIKPQSEHLQKGRFLSGENHKAVRYADDKRRERQGKRVINIHEKFTDNSIPAAHYLKEWILDFHGETGVIPDTLAWPYMTKTKAISLYMPEIKNENGWHVVTLRIEKSEFSRLEFRGDNGQ